jgi:hypothetical protein
MNPQPRITRAFCNYRAQEGKWHVVTLARGVHGSYVYWDWAGGGFKPRHECAQIATEDVAAAEQVTEAHNALVALARAG